MLQFLKNFIGSVGAKLRLKFESPNFSLKKN